MARTLIKKLSDGKEYKFTTLSRSELRGFQKEFNKNSKKTKRLMELENKIAQGEDLNEVELKEYEDANEAAFKTTNKMIRSSLAQAHPEFKYVGNDKDEEVDNKLDNLLDVRDTSQIIEFITTGTVKKDVEEVASNDDLRL